ncbi:MAG TPA: HAD-IB family hydrolase [Candidatus Binatia bacterium]|jgi:putative phosphoserine phosphatase/1-acylglycerol-3-phosphate O-acyltransferase
MLNRGILTREIEKGSAGPQIGAFFDLDRTLIAGFSASAFVREWLTSGRAAPAEIAAAASAAAAFQLGQKNFSAFVSESLAMVRGLTEKEWSDIGEKLFGASIAASIFPESRALVDAHRSRGHTLAVISSATRAQVTPVARELGIEHVFCTELEVKEGKLTGQVLRPACYGPGKADAATRFAGEREIDLSQSYFYTDSDEDLPLLLIVGKPRPINPSRRLQSIAAKRIWPVRSFSSRGLPSVTDLVRTSLSLGSMLPSFLLGLPAAILDRDYRQAVNLAATTWGELGTALAGVHVTVQGEEHLWSKRPAVFIFNHQSGIDPLLVCKLLRRDFVGISKQEIRNVPVLGQLFEMAGTIFVDRFNHVEAVKALEPAIEALGRGLSIAIAPEGTRSLGPRLGRFKKGAFRIAMAAGVPVVPIVIHNAVDALPKHAIVIRPATVAVTVLPPVPTSDWTAGDLDRRIEAIRDDYRKVLEHDAGALD